jgi:ferredoxin
MVFKPGAERVAIQPRRKAVVTEPVRTYVDVDRTKCIGSGNCTIVAQELFDLDDQGLVILLDPDPESFDTADVAEAGCPARAIRVIRPARRTTKTDTGVSDVS